MKYRQVTGRYVSLEGSLLAVIHLIHHLQARHGVTYKRCCPPGDLVDRAELLCNAYDAVWGPSFVQKATPFLTVRLTAGKETNKSVRKNKSYSTLRQLEKLRNWRRRVHVQFATTLSGIPRVWSMQIHDPSPHSFSFFLPGNMHTSTGFTRHCWQSKWTSHVVSVKRDATDGRAVTDMRCTF